MMKELNGWGLYPDTETSIHGSLKYYELYIDIADRVAMQSHDPNTKVGCVIVKNNNILSFGWNGTPSHMSNECKEMRDGRMRTRPEVIHAEANAIAKLAKSTTQGSENSTAYVTVSPCMDCSKQLLQAGVKQLCIGKLHNSKNHDVMKPLEFLKEAGLEIYIIDNDRLYKLWKKRQF